MSKSATCTAILTPSGYLKEVRTQNYAWLSTVFGFTMKISNHINQEHIFDIALFFNSRCERSTLLDTVFTVAHVHVGWLIIKQFITFNYLSNNRIEQVYCLNLGNRIAKSLFTSWTGSKRLLDGMFLDNPAASS